jgi:hypothetical protein
MAVTVDASIVSAVERTGGARVLVTFDHRPTERDLAPYDVVFEYASIQAAAIRVDREALDRLAADDNVVSIELDGEIRASS